MNLTIITSLISAAIAASVGFGTAWTLQGRTIDNLKIEALNDRIAIQRAARQTLERHMSTVSVAQTKAASRAVTLAAELAGNRSELERLRSASAASLRAASGNLDACTTSLAAHALISTQCSERYSTLAADADSWASHAVSLQDAWPK